MRIALFTDSYPPRIDGIARVCELEKIELERLGHEVKVICPDRPGHPYSKDDSVIPLPSVSGVFYEGLRLGRMTSRAKQNLEAWGADLVHIHTPLSVGLAGLRFSRKNNIPSITTCHADFDLAAEYPALFLVAIWLPLIMRLYTGYKTDFRALPRLYKARSISRARFFSRWLFAQFSNAVTYTTTPSAKITTQITPYVTGTIYTVGFGAEESETVAPELAKSFRTKHDIKPDTFLVISTTRLVKEKRVQLLLEGMANALSKQPDLDVLLVVVGGGPEKASLEKLARSLQIQDHVLFTGSVKNNVLRTILPACNAYANPSLRETFALSACEAALSQLPLLMSDEDLQGVFLPGKTGLLFHDASELGDAIIQMFNDPELCQTLGEAAQTEALRYTPKQAVKRILEIASSTRR